jgi:2'-5' RNA ligase
MDMQLDFFGTKDALGRRLSKPRGPVESHRLYFTVVPPPAVAQDTAHKAELLARRFGVRHTTPATRLHVSLNTVWRADEQPQPALIEEALEVGDAVRRPRFDIAFNTLQTWSGDSRSRTGGRSIVPTVLACSGGAREAQALFADIRREMHRLGLAGSERTTTPHMTLWYSHIRAPELVLDRPCRWHVDKFWLVQTVRGQSRPEYLGEWSLG